MERMLKLQTHSVKTQKSSLAELRDLNRGVQKGEVVRSAAESEVHDSPSPEERSAGKLAVKEQFQIELRPQVTGSGDLKEGQRKDE
jgi:hypothetical protein